MGQKLAEVGRFHTSVAAQSQNQGIVAAGLGEFIKILTTDAAREKRFRPSRDDQDGGETFFAVNHGVVYGRSLGADAYSGDDAFRIAACVDVARGGQDRGSDRKRADRSVGLGHGRPGGLFQIFQGDSIQHRSLYRPPSISKGIEISTKSLEKHQSNEGSGLNLEPPGSS